MRHGFKAEAERIAAQARSELGLKPLDAICPWAYAASLGVVVLEFANLSLAGKHRVQLTQVDGDSWSGLTLREEGRHFILLNPSHSRARQCSTLMHEIAHIKLKHVPGRVDISISGLMLLSDYPDDQEQEADWLSAAILLPRDALISWRGQGATIPAICEAYGISEQLCEWRLRMTGVDTQLRHSARRAGSAR